METKTKRSNARPPVPPSVVAGPPPVVVATTDAEPDVECCAWLTEPATWRTVLFLYFFFGAIDIMVWPTIWCSIALPPVAGLHVCSEGWAVSRLLFNRSRVLQPLWIALYVILVVITLAFSAHGFDIFGIWFVSTDSMSLVVGTYLFGTAIDVRLSRLGGCFAIHGLITMVLTPILLSGYVLESDLLFPFVLIVLFAAAQMLLVTGWLTGEYDTKPPLQVVWTNKERRNLLCVWAVYALCIGSVFLFAVRHSPQPCQSFGAMITFMQIAFPIVGTLGLLLPSACRRLAQLKPPAHAPPLLEVDGVNVV